MDPDLYLPEGSFFLPLLAFLALAFFVFGGICVFKLGRFLKRRRGRRNQRKGRSGEVRAAQLLKRKGYRILEVTPCFQSQLLVNGALTDFEIKPDLVVEKKGIRYVVEVKHHSEQCTISRASVRRQVLEYLHASQYPCLLVCMPGGEIDHLELNTD